MKEREILEKAIKNKKENMNDSRKMKKEPKLCGRQKNMKNKIKMRKDCHGRKIFS